MLIPIKCFTCGNLLADKYRWYLRRVRQLKLANAAAASSGSESTGAAAAAAADVAVDESKVRYFTPKMKGRAKTEEGQVLDELHMKLQCCRRHMLTHVDIE
jgi:DNA-directed RNA polymerase subunit N (RpoN/RPB10)